MKAVQKMMVEGDTKLIKDVLGADNVKTEHLEEITEEEFEKYE